MDIDQAHATTIDRPGPAGPSAALDDAFDRMGVTDFELPNGFVNHGPMACEALWAMGLDDSIPGWARWFVQMVGDGPRPAVPGRRGDFEGLDALGDYRRLPEWMGYFEQAVASEGWQRVVELWVPRLMPGMATALFHGVIRTAHAVRAVSTVETGPRQAELVRALSYWAARFHPGQTADEASIAVAAVDAVGPGVVAAAAHGARHYLVQPTIFNLHGVTGAMAVAVLVDHIGPDDAVAALARLRVEHAALYDGEAPVTASVTEPTSGGFDPGLAPRAADSRDAHQVKLVEACRRGWASSGDAAFADAARLVSD